MTLIAGFFRNGYPILMGDVLISSSDKSNTEFVLPTVGKRISKNDLSEGEYTPSSLCQKVILVSPKLAVAWAGTKFYATTFIRDIVDANCHKNPSRDLLSDIFNGKDGYGDIQTICLYRDGTKWGIVDFRCFPVDCPNPEFSYFSAGGSGYQQLLDLVKKEDLKHVHGKINKLEMAIFTSMFLSSALLSQEIANPSQLKNLFGAGYETVHPLGLELSKYNDISYFFWKTEEEKRGSWIIPSVPFLSIKYSYHSDMLIMRSVRTSLETGTDKCVIDMELRVISPIHKDSNPEELLDYSPPTMNSKWMSNVFFGRNHLGKIGMYASLIHHNFKLKKPPIMWLNEFDRNTASIYVDGEFVRNLVKQTALWVAKERS